MIHPTNRGQIVCKLCNFTRQSNPRISLEHRIKCGGLGTEDYSTICNIHGFESLRNLMPSNSAAEAPHSGDAANPLIFGESSSIQPLNPVDFFTITYNQAGVMHNGAVCQLCDYICPNGGHQELREHRRNCQVSSVNLITVNTRPQALEPVCICFVCCKSSNRPHFNLQTTQTMFSSMNLIRTLELLTDLQSSKITGMDQICSECFNLINKYDEAATAAIQIKHQIDQRVACADIFRNNNRNNVLLDEANRMPEQDNAEKSDENSEMSGGENYAEDIIDLAADEIEEGKENRMTDVIDLIDDDDDDDGGLDNIGT